MRRILDRPGAEYQQSGMQRILDDIQDNTPHTRQHAPWESVKVATPQGERPLLTADYRLSVKRILFRSNNAVRPHSLRYTTITLKNADTGKSLVRFSSADGMPARTPVTVLSDDSDEERHTGGLIVERGQTLVLGWTSLDNSGGTTIPPVPNPNEGEEAPEEEHIPIDAGGELLRLDVQISYEEA